MMLNLGIVLITTFWLNSLCAIHITTEFFPEKRIPSEYYVPNNGDLTLIKLEEWPEGSTITIYEKRLTSPKPTQKSTFRYQDTSIPPIFAFYSVGYTPGETIKLTFKDSNKNLIEEMTIVPSPLYVKSSFDNAKIEATLCEISPVIYRISFTEFQKDEMLLMKSSSYHECTETEIACDNAEVRMYMPEVLGKKGGLAKLSYERPEGELLKLELPWGLEWIKYSLYRENGKVKNMSDNQEFLKKNPGVAEYFKGRRS